MSISLVLMTKMSLSLSFKSSILIRNVPLRELNFVPEPNHNQTRARNPPTEAYYLCRGGDNRRVSLPKKKYGGVSSSNLLVLDSPLYHPRGQELLKLLCRLSPKESFSTDRCSNTSSDLYFFSTSNRRQMFAY